jgi:pyridoxine 4-dehydrogenase
MEPDASYVSLQQLPRFRTLSNIYSETNLRRSVDLILEKLGENKKLDLFECARVDKKHPIEETIGW